jgi:DNA polymerase
LLKKENPALYGLAKAAVLGAGYGCGPTKYKVVAKNMADIYLSEEEAAHQVTLFRQQNPKVVALWNNFSFKAKLSASHHHDFTVALPSGRKLHYFKPSLVNGLTACTALDHKKVSFLHGGLLTENYVQAVARDVFTLGLTRLAYYGYQNLFHVHDEYVLELEKVGTTHESDEKRLRDILSGDIPWLPNCPLDVEFKWRQRYG